VQQEAHFCFLACEGEGGPPAACSLCQHSNADGNDDDDDGGDDDDDEDDDNNKDDADEDDDDDDDDDDDEYDGSRELAVGCACEPFLLNPWFWGVFSNLQKRPHAGHAKNDIWQFYTLVTRRLDIFEHRLRPSRKI